MHEKKLVLTVKEQKNPKTGNPITVVTGLTHNPQVIEKIEKNLKSSCGAGGFVKGKTITIQGSHTDKIRSILEKDGYKVKTG